MPFSEPFRDFTSGDLIYGIHEERDPVWRAQNAKGVQLLLMEQFWIIASDLRNKANQRAYGSAGELTQAFHAKLLEHVKFSAALPKGEATQGGIDRAADNADVRMKDKGGLYWAASEGRHVHFLLDGLDMNRVVTKTARTDSKPDAERKLRAITGAELRYIYRNRHSKAFHACIQFWKNEIQIGPPWGEYLDFRPIRSNSRSAQLPVRVVQVAPPQQQVWMVKGAATWAKYTPRSEVG